MIYTRIMNCQLLIFMHNILHHYGQLCHAQLDCLFYILLVFWAKWYFIGSIKLCLLNIIVKQVFLIKIYHFQQLFISRQLYANMFWSLFLFTHPIYFIHKMKISKVWKFGKKIAKTKMIKAYCLDLTQKMGKLKYVQWH